MLILEAADSWRIPSGPTRLGRCRRWSAFASQSWRGSTSASGGSRTWHGKRRIFRWKTSDFPVENRDFPLQGKKNAEGVLGIFPNQKKKNDRSHCGMVAPPSNLVGRGVTIDYFSAIKWEHFWGLMMIKLYFTVYPDVGLSENGYPYINPLFNHNYISFLDLL